MTVSGTIQVEMFGGPLDGLRISVPDYSAELRFPVLDADIGCWAVPLESDPSERPFHDITYYRSPDDIHRFEWRYFR